MFGVLERDWLHGLRNRRGFTALHAACFRGNVEMAAFLLRVS